MPHLFSGQLYPGTGWIPVENPMRDKLKWGIIKAASAYKYNWRDIVNTTVNEQYLVPSPRYRIKMGWSITVVALSILACGALTGWLISFDRDTGARGGWIAFIVTVGLALLWWLPAMLLVGPYYRSLRYEIGEDKVIVRVGIWTRSVKHVPYRTVTNLTVRRGVLDRWLGLGSLDIQTAGISGTSKAEQSLVGLENADEVYALVAAELRRFRGAMAPTAAGEEGEASGASSADSILTALLSEVRAIRQTLEQRD
jgi:membrane protein YdbS with pleckstrin-like domain